jgi:hypothetical protein
MNDLTELEKKVVSSIDTGACREHIIDDIRRHDGEKFSVKEIHRAISQLKRDGDIRHVSNGYYKVENWFRYDRRKR